MAQKQQTTQPKPDSKAVAVRTAHEMLDARAKDFASSLPSHIPSDRFIRTVKTAITNDPSLAECNQRLLLVECSKAAADGLVIDGREATLTIYNTNQRKLVNNKWTDNWQKLPKYIPMYPGLIKRARNTGEILSWQANIFYAKELEVDKTLGRPRFVYTAGDDAKIVHDPIVTGDRGPVAGAYSIVRLKNGVTERLVMTIEELRKIQSRTKAKKKVSKQGEPDRYELTGPWKTDEEEMFKKTVIRRHSKTLPMSSDLARVFARDDDMYEVDDEKITPTKQRGVAASRVKTGKQDDDTAPHGDSDAQPKDGDVIDAEYREVDDENPAPKGAQQNSQDEDDQRDPI